MRTVISAGKAAEKELATRLGLAWRDTELLIDVIAEDDLEGTEHGQST